MCGQGKQKTSWANIQVTARENPHTHTQKYSQVVRMPWGGKGHHHEHSGNINTDLCHLVNVSTEGNGLPFFKAKSFPIVTC